MRRPARGLIYGTAGLTLFGVAYDTGLFGTPDGFDHSTVVSLTAAFTATTSFATYFTAINMVTGKAEAPVPAYWMDNLVEYGTEPRPDSMMPSTSAIALLGTATLATRGRPEPPALPWVR
jgi:hypothetical protein